MKPIDGRFRFFYCTGILADLPHPDVPTRDVGRRHKTEPYLEEKVENWCRCRARFITAAAKRARQLQTQGGQHYLLLTTRRPSDGRPFVVGVMPFAEEAFLRLRRRHPNRWSEENYLPYASDNRMKLVSFASAFPLSDWMQEEGLRTIPGGQGGRGRVPRQLLSKLLAHFSAKPDRTGSFIANVKALESRLRKDNPGAWDGYNGRLDRGDRCANETRREC